MKKHSVLRGLLISAFLLLPTLTMAKLPVYPNKVTSFILPLENNQQESLGQVHEELKKELLNHWGNYRITSTTQGMLNNNGEAVEVPAILYTVVIKCDNTQPALFTRVIRAAQTSAQLETLEALTCNDHIMKYPLNNNP